MADYPASSRQSASFSIPSIIAIVCAAGAWFVGPGWSILLAIVAIIAGLLGAVVAVSPAKRGGMLSIMAILMSALAIVVSVIVIIFKILA